MIGEVMSLGVLSIEHENGKMDIPDSALIVGIDETGCEDYKDKKFPVFGIGGCAVLARDYFRFLDEPWKMMKDNHFGGQENRLHASDLHKPTDKQLQALELFFTKIPFFRFATMSAHTFDNNSGETSIHLLVTSIMHQVCEFATLAQPSNIIFIVEHSERIGKEVMHYLSSYKFGNEDCEITPKVLYATKGDLVTCLEVADFVVHPAGAQVRNRINNKPNNRSPIRKDFEVVFNNIDERLSNYQEILAAQPNVA